MTPSKSKQGSSIQISRRASFGQADVDWGSGSLESPEIDRLGVLKLIEAEVHVHAVIDRVVGHLGMARIGRDVYPTVVMAESGQTAAGGGGSENEAQVARCGYCGVKNSLFLDSGALGHPTILGREICKWFLQVTCADKGEDLSLCPKGMFDVLNAAVIAAVERALIANSLEGASAVRRDSQSQTAASSSSPHGETLAPPSTNVVKVSRPRIAQDFTELVGNTPMVLLKSPFGIAPNVKVWGKLENFNPGGSVKDRTALAMILDAEKRGILKPGDTIVESTSGNLGHALAMLARARGYKFIVVVDSKTPADNLNLFKILGVEVEFVNQKDQYGSTQANRMLRSQEIARTRPGCVNLNQYENLAAREVHYMTTGPEIYEQMMGKIDVLVGTVGTGSHLCGTSRFLKEKIPGLQVVGVEPEGSILFGGIPRPYLQNGNGSVFVPGNYDASVLDIKLKVSDADAMNAVRSVAKKNGLLFGGSSGAPLKAAFEYAERCTGPTNIVVLLPDGGSKYMGTVYNDDWMRAHNLMDPADTETPSPKVAQG